MLSVAIPTLSLLIIPIIAFMLKSSTEKKITEQEVTTLSIFFIITLFLLAIGCFCSHFLTNYNPMVIEAIIDTNNPHYQDEIFKHHFKLLEQKDNVVFFKAKTSDAENFVISKLEEIKQDSTKVIEIESYENSAKDFVLGVVIFKKKEYYMLNISKNGTNEKTIFSSDSVQKIFYNDNEKVLQKHGKPCLEIKKHYHSDFYYCSKSITLYLPENTIFEPCNASDASKCTVVDFFEKE